MLSQHTLRRLRWLIEGGQVLRISIFAWDHPTGSACVTKSKLTWCIVITMVAYLLVQFAFEVTQLYRLAYDPAESLTNYSKLALQCCTRIVAAGATIDSCFHGERMACIFNQSLLLNKRFREVESGRILEDTMRTLSRVGLLLSFGYPVIAVTSFLQDSHQSRYWHHLVFPTAIFPFTLPFICVIEYLITSQNLHATIVYIFNSNVYFKTVNAYMELIVKMRKCPGSQWRNDCLWLFRTVQVYNQDYNNCVAFMWTYSMAGFLVIEVGEILCSLRLTPVVPFPTNLMFPVGAIGMAFVTINIYSATSKATDMSQDLAQKYKKSTDKYYRRVGASMKPLYVEVCSFFVMTSSTSFSFTSEVVDKVISILLST